MALEYIVQRCADPSFRKIRVPISRHADEQEAIKAAGTEFSKLEVNPHNPAMRSGPEAYDMYISIMCVDTENDDGGSAVMDTDGRWVAYILNQYGKPNMTIGHQRRGPAHARVTELNGGRWRLWYQGYYFYWKPGSIFMTVSAQAGGDNQVISVELEPTKEAFVKRCEEWIAEQS